MKLRTNLLDFESDQVKGQGQGHEGFKNYWTKLHEIFGYDLSLLKISSQIFSPREKNLLNMFCSTYLP